MPDVAEQTAWERALRDPTLQDLPYKIETNEYDQIVLSPYKPQHSFRQSDIMERKRRLYFDGGHKRSGRATKRAP